MIEKIVLIISPCEKTILFDFQYTLIVVNPRAKAFCLR